MPNTPGTYDYKYPIAGAQNSTVSVHSYDLKSRATRQLAVPLPEEGYIPRIIATSDADKLAVVTLNRHPIADGSLHGQSS